MGIKHLLLAAAIGVGCGGAVAATQLKTAESNHYIGNLPTYAAAYGGMLKAAGIEVEVITMKGGPASASALLSHDVDVLNVSADQAVKMKSLGQKVKILASLTQRAQYAVVVPTSSTAKTLTDVKGKKIGVTAFGSSTDVGTRAWIAEENMNPDADFQILGLGSSTNVMVAFQQGQIDVATISSPPLLRLLEKGRALRDFRNFPYQELCVIALEEDLTGPKAPAIKAYVQALVAAQKKLNSDKAFTAEVIKNSFPELSADLVNTLTRNSIDEFHSFPNDGKVSRESFANVIEALTKTKAIAKPVRYEDLVDTRFLPQ
jgi:ABC-type nitrate/sulfonate/bicarbonate transport system substrate-binding protein